MLKNGKLMQKDEGKGGAGHRPSPKKHFPGECLTEPVTRSNEISKLLSFMRGEPVDFGEPMEPAELLFLDSPRKK